MDKKQIASVLKEMAAIMEIRGDNPFKIRAHENAARIIEGFSGDIQEAISSGEIANIKGIGKGMVDKITQLNSSGELDEHKELRDSIPPGLLQVARVSGMGPKKVKAAWKELDITSLDQLEAAATDGKLGELKGFGGKVIEKILGSIELLRKYEGKVLQSVARAAAEELKEAVQNIPGVVRCEFGGSLRRNMEVIEDIDLLAGIANGDAADIMKQWSDLEMVETVTTRGDASTAVRLKNGLSAELRLIDDDQFANALHHLTGSKTHNQAIRQHALQLGFKVSELGLFRNDDLIACKDEADLFGQLGMAWIPPELRENQGEIEAALSNKLPKLIEESDIKGIIHAHSLWSDGVNSIAEMASACKERGYEYLAISDHSKAAAYANGLTEERILKQHEEIDALNKELNDFRVLKSIECDILRDGELDYADEVLASFDLVIVSIHSAFNMTEAEATDRVIKAIGNPHVTILGHLTGRLLLQREGYPLDQHAVIEAAADLGVSIEINANPRRLDLDWRYLQYALSKGVTISINPDAHRIEGINDMQYGIGVARKGWLTADQVLNCRTAEEVVQFAQARR